MFLKLIHFFGQRLSEFSFLNLDAVWTQHCVLHVTPMKRSSDAVFEKAIRVGFQNVLILFKTNVYMDLLDSRIIHSIVDKICDCGVI